MVYLTGCATAFRRREHRAFRAAVLGALQAEYGLRYRAAAERAFSSADRMDPIGVARAHGLRVDPSNAREAAGWFAVAYDRGIVD